MGLEYSPKIVNNGLVLYYNAADTLSYGGSGTNLYDLSGYGNNGTLVNGPTFSTDGVGYIRLDGADDKLLVPKDINGFTHNIQYDINWTLECWMYMHTPDSSPQNYKMIYGNYNGCNGDAFSGNAQGFIIYNANNPAGLYCNFSFGPKYTGSPCCSPSQCPDIGFNFNNTESAWVYEKAVNKWCHWVLTSNNGLEYKLYVNGEQQGSTKTVNFRDSVTRANSNITSTSKYGWGSHEPNANSANEVDFSIIRMYNQPLSELEIQQNYNSHKGKFGL